MEQIETIFRYGYTLRQDEVHFRLGTDSVLLAAFPPLRKHMRICDFGCGTGALTLLTAGREPTARIDGLEMLPSAAALARRNVTENGLEDRVRIVTGDIKDAHRLLPANAYDLIVSNPPYFQAGTGAACPAAEKAAARSDGGCTPEDLCQAAAKLLKFGGRLALVYRTERLTDMLCAMRGARIEPKRLRFVAHTAASLPRVFLLEGILGGGPGLRLEAPLIIKNDDGTDCEEVRKIYGTD